MDGIIRIVAAWLAETSLYKVVGEDGPEFYYDFYVMAEDADGNCLAHDHVFKWFDRESAERFLRNVEVRGMIDLKYWKKCPPTLSLEEQWNAEARREQEERFRNP
jgi:hypothetical protein